MTATTPTVVVQVAPGVGPLVDVTDGQWVTLTTSAIVSVRYGHGRGSEFDTFNAGTLTVTFEDRTRVFDPLNASGAYYGNLNPGMQIRVRGFISPTYYPRWRGFVESIVTTNARTTTFVTLTCSDAFKILNQSKLPESVYQSVVVDRSPWLYWRLGAAGPVVEDISGNGRPGAVSVGVSAGAPPIRKYSEFSLDVNGVFDAVKTDADVIISFPFTLEFWIQSELTGTANITIAEQPANAGSVTTDRWLVYYDPVNQELNVGKAPGAGGSHGDKWDLSAFADGNPHQIVIDFTASISDCVLYVDREPVLRQVGGGGVNLAGTRIYIGQSAPDTALVSYPGNIGDFVIYNAELTATQIAENWDAAINPWDGDTTGERITRILDLIGWPAGLRAIDAGEKILGPADLAGVTALQYLQLVAQTEGGRFFIDKSGNVTFHDAGRFLRETVENTSQYTFSDDEAGDAVYAGGNFSRDDKLVYNQASIQRKYGLPQTAEDTTSVQNFGPRTYSLSGLLHRSDSIAHGLAEELVYRYKDPQSRVAALTVQPQVDAGSWPTIFALEIGHRVTVEQKPANQGAQIAVDLHIEQITESVNGDVWTLTFLCSPTDPHEANYFTWGGNGATQGWDTGVWR